jgi:hypothetical protein
MRISRFMSNVALTTGVVAGAALAVSATPTFANTIVIVSDGSTLAAATSSTFAGLTTGDTTGLTFTSALVGPYGTNTPVPAGAPAGTDVINIPPSDQYGFFEVPFTLPSGATNVSISGSANVDDEGWIFINGHRFGYATQYSNATFDSNVASNFVVGVNEFLVSDINSGGGPSGAAFFATVNYDVSQTPLPAALPLFAGGLGVIGLLARRRKRKATAVLAAV